MDDERSKRHLEDETLRFIRFKAKQIAGRYGFHRDEFEDVEQTLIVQCLERMVRFDSRRATRQAFSRLIVNRGIATMIESHKARCRDYRLCQLSLSSPSDSDDPGSPQLAEAVSEDDYHSRLNRRSHSLEEGLLLIWDVERTVAALPPELRRICRLLMALDHLADVANAAGVSRATLHRRMRTIRAALVAAGLLLPTRPTKTTDSRSKHFDGDSVEVDAIPAGTPRAIVRECIQQHIDRRQLESTKLAEEQEPATLARLLKPVGRDT